jgi:BON domain
MKSIVIGSDGELGLVEQIRFDPVSGQARELVVTSRALESPITVPMDAVSSADGSAVRVGMSAVALRQTSAKEDEHTRGDEPWRPILRGREVTAPWDSSLSTGPDMSPSDTGTGRGHQGLPPLTTRQTVLCRDGSLGRIDRVLLEEKSRNPTHIVVHCTDDRRHDVTIPLWWISEVTPDRVAVDAAWTQLNSCPGYRPDDEITGDVQATVLRLSALDPKDLWQVEVWTHDGVVELRGITRTDWARATLERLTREIAGVVAVRNTVQELSATRSAGW